MRILLKKFCDTRIKPNLSSKAEWCFGCFRLHSFFSVVI